MIKGLVIKSDDNWVVQIEKKKKSFINGLKSMDIQRSEEYQRLAKFYKFDTLNQFKKFFFD